MKKQKKQVKKKGKRGSPKEIHRQVQLIQTLATRLPWIAVTVILISMLFILLEIYLKRGG